MLAEFVLVLQKVPSMFEVKEAIKGTQNFGKCYTATGMKSGYLGAFTKSECKFISQLIKNLNSLNILYIISDVNDKNLTNGNDLHLFCGSSYFCKYRIDINPESKANFLISVQEFLADCIRNEVKFDLIIFDPPFNAHYDVRYGTHHLNKIQDGRNFLRWLVESCLKLANDGAILLSKNWRSIHPEQSRSIFKVVSFYGGFRRITLLEAWQYKAPVDKTLEFKQRGFNSIDWILGDNHRLSESEIEKIEKFSSGKIAFISDEIIDNIKITANFFTPNEFLKSKERFDTIILNKCQKIGGAIKLTSQLKKDIQARLLPHGYAILKTYFNPALKKLKQIEQILVTYPDYGKVDLFTVYEKIGGNLLE